jgi:4-hydroxy-4-methyl-2-oxoglutarate aldolase
MQTTTQYKPLRLMKKDMRLINPFDSVMVGFAFTVHSNHPNDFLALFRGLMEAPANCVLVYANDFPPDKALAGELFTTQAFAKGLAGLVIDGPVRDTAALQTIPLPVYATSVTPYAGT